MTFHQITTVFNDEDNHDILTGFAITLREQIYYDGKAADTDSSALGLVQPYRPGTYLTSNDGAAPPSNRVIYVEVGSCWENCVLLFLQVYVGRKDNVLTPINNFVLFTSSLLPSFLS